MQQTPVGPHLGLIHQRKTKPGSDEGNSSKDMTMINRQITNPN